MTLVLRILLLIGALLPWALSSIASVNQRFASPTLYIGLFCRILVCLRLFPSLRISLLGFVYESRKLCPAAGIVLILLRFPSVTQAL